MGRPTALAVLALGAMLVAACSTEPTAMPSPAGYVPWLPLKPQGHYVDGPQRTAPPGPPVLIPSGTPACVASQLEARSGWEGAAAGNHDTPIAFRNRSASRCFVEGYPDVAVLDRKGALLVQASGLSGRGTYFDSWPVVPVLMQPGVPPFPPDVFPNVGTMPSLRGEAFLNLSWYDCRQPQAAWLGIDLPNGGGRLTTPFVFKGAYSSACPRTDADGVSRGPLSPAGYTTPSGFLFSDLSISLQAPASAPHGSTLTFYVTLTNHDQVGFSLEPCPDYREILDKASIQSYQLNCLPVSRIAPGDSVTFQMKAQVPASSIDGAHFLTWALLDGRLSQNFASTTIEVT
jgi:hypothetical protein